MSKRAVVDEDGDDRKSPKQNKSGYRSQIVSSYLCVSIKELDYLIAEHGLPSIRDEYGPVCARNTRSW